MITLGGNICIRNGFDLDYCFREAIESLLPVCDEVVVCDGESTDGTQEFIRVWMQREPKIKLCVYKWPNPKGDPDFWVSWIQYCRSHITSDYEIQLDADEVLSEKSYPAIQEFKQSKRKPRMSFWCNRYNFWRDTKSLIPHGVCLGHRVVRIAPQDVWMPSDGCHALGAEAVEMAVHSGIEIFHYGFLRKTEAFFRKARALQGYFFNGFDQRLADVENKSGWMTEVEGVEWTSRLMPFEGEHPLIMKNWLKERGF